MICPGARGRVDSYGIACRLGNTVFVERTPCFDPLLDSMNSSTNCAATVRGTRLVRRRPFVVNLQHGMVGLQMYQYAWSRLLALNTGRRWVSRPFEGEQIPPNTEARPPPSSVVLLILSAPPCACPHWFQVLHEISRCQAWRLTSDTFCPHRAILSVHSIQL